MKFSHTLLDWQAYKFPLIILFLLMIIFSLFYFKYVSINKTSISKNLPALAETIIQECQRVQDKEQCFKKRILNLSTSQSNYTMSELFSITDLIQQQSVNYFNCHDLAHQLGEKEAKKNPNKWKDVVSMCPTTLCNSGCSHGAIVAKYKSDYLDDSQLDSLVSELKDICLPRSNWQPSSSEIYNCQHGLGHLGMYVTRADIDKSIEICELITNGADSQYEETCVGGIFMTIFQPLDTDDMALIAKIAPSETTKSVNDFCQQFSGTAFDACHRESWIYFWDQIQTPEGFAQFCGYTKDTISQLKCYSRTISPIASNFVLKEDNLAKMANFCESLPAKFTSVCFAHTARRVVQINSHFIGKAVDICKMAASKNPESGETCFTYIINYGRWIYNIDSQKKEYEDYCAAFPTAWKNRCLSHVN